jgi:cytochrome c oxidase assembly protein subunit 15
MSLTRFALVVAALTLLLMNMGGLVHNTRSSLVCPDWPGCNGELLPSPSDTAVFLEHYAHRSVGATIGVLSLALAIALGIRARRTRDAGLLALGLAGVALVSIVGALGRYTVLNRLPPWASTSKLALATITLELFVYIAYRARSSRSTSAARDTRVAAVTGAAAAIVYAQMVLGAWMRHLGAGLSCLDLPLCQAGLLPLGAHEAVLVHAAHRLMGVVALTAVVFASVVTWRRMQGRTFMRALAVALPILMLVQITLGVVSIVSFLDVVPVTLHLLGAALIITGLVVLNLEARGVRGRSVSATDAPIVDGEGALAA